MHSSQNFSKFFSQNYFYMFPFSPDLQKNLTKIGVFNQSYNLDVIA